MQLSGIFSTNQSVALNSIFGNRQQSHKSSSSFDIVSISDEAIAAYENSKASASSAISNSFEKVTGINERLTAFFNRYHSGTTSSEKQNSIEFNGELLPENKALKENIEAQVDKLLAEEKYTPGEMPSPEFLEKFNALYQQLNTVAALGSVMPITEDVLQQSAAYLQNLENEWSAGNTITYSDTISQSMKFLENSRFDFLKEFFGEQES